MKKGKSALIVIRSRGGRLIGDKGKVAQERASEGAEQIQRGRGGRGRGEKGLSVGGGGEGVCRILRSCKKGGREGGRAAQISNHKPVFLIHINFIMQMCR